MSELIPTNILSIFSSSNDPYTTDEIIKLIKQPRHIIINRLNKLAIGRKIKGKQTKNRGPWIWWMPVEKTENKKELIDKINQLENQIQKLQQSNSKLRSQLNKTKEKY